MQNQIIQEAVPPEVTPEPAPPAEEKPRTKRAPKKAKRVKVAPKAVPTNHRGRAPRTELPIDEMTKDELKLVRFLYSAKGPRVGFTIHALERQLFGGDNTNTSRTRNTVRRPLRYGWVEIQEPSKAEVAAHEAAKKGRLYSRYRLTEKGRKRGIK